jgi:hypothetical protein
LEISVCLQDSAVIIDTSSLPLIARAAYQITTGHSTLRSDAGNEPLFIATFEELLRRLSACARGETLLTTTFLYDEEMNPELPGWVFSQMPYLSSIHASDVYRPQLERTLNQQIRRVAVRSESVRTLQQYLRDHVGYDIGFRDTSLIFLGLEIAAEGNVFLVTDDRGLLEAMTALQRQRNIQIGEHTYATREPHPLPLIAASRSVHGCCELDSRGYCEIFAAYHHHLLDRQHQGAISAAALVAHGKTMAEAAGLIYLDCDGKSHLEQEARITREMERHFSRGDQE